MKISPFDLGRAVGALLFFSAALTALRGATTAVAAPPDPIEGKWAGTFRSGEDHVAYGLEIRRNDQGELTVSQFLPEIHNPGFPLGTLTRTAGRDLYHGALDLNREGDQLTGSFPGTKLTVSLHRAGTLPLAPPPVSVPPGPVPLWTYNAHSPFWSTPTIAGGVAFLGSADGVLHAIHIADGRRDWTHPTGGAIYGGVLAAHDTLYLINDAGVLLALDRATGRERWRCELGGGSIVRNLPAATSPYDFDYQAPTPVLADGVLYAGAADGGFHAIAAGTGRPLWRFAAGGKIRTTALVVGERVVFGALDNFVYALDRKTGALQWRADAGGAVTTAPVLAGGNILVGTRGYRLVALRPADGARAWERFQWFSWVESTPRLDGGVLYLGSSDNRKVRALDPADGRTRWSTDVNGWAWAQPAVSADTVFASSAGTADHPSRYPPEGSLSALDRRTGALRWRRIVPARRDVYLTGFVGAPVVAGDRVIVGGLDGVLYAFPTGEKKPSDPAKSNGAE
jgi:outer membrane protein assembly factor BamB